MDLNTQILAAAERYEPYIIDCRRKVHAFAEPAAAEVRTHEFILEQARRLGLPYEEVPTTSVIVKLDTGRPGMTVALRADMDALPMEEDAENLTGPRTCLSQRPGGFHGCGHDGHTAMLLGAMEILSGMVDELRGTVLFCFEEGEERNSGVAALLAALEKYHVDRCWAIHLYAGLDQGKLSVDPGPRMAGAAGIRLTFIGRSGHGSRPDLAVNPLFCGASFLNNLCVAFCNRIAAGKTVTMGITTFHAGEAPNVIADTARIEGTFRFFDLEEGKKALDITRQIADHTAAMHGCRVEYDPDMFRFIAGPTVTDPACAEVAERVLGQMLPEGTLASCEPWYAGESFRLWLERYPGVFAFLGINAPASGYGAPHHNGKFDFSESVLKTGAAASARFAAEWLRRDA